MPFFSKLAFHNKILSSIITTSYISTHASLGPEDSNGATAGGREREEPSTQETVWSGRSGAGTVCKHGRCFAQSGESSSRKGRLGKLSALHTHILLFFSSFKTVCAFFCVGV